MSSLMSTSKVDMAHGNTWGMLAVVTVTSTESISGSPGTTIHTRGSKVSVPGACTNLEYSFHPNR